MITLTITDMRELTIFWLIFTRCLATLFQFPIFDTFSIPGIIKILFALVLAYCFHPLLRDVVLQDMTIAGNGNFFLLTIFYTLVGAFIGFLLKLIMDIFLIGGAIITQSIGFSAVRYFDPSFLQRVGPFEMYMQWVLLLLVLISGALVPMFKGMYLSFWGINLSTIGSIKFSYSTIYEIFNSIFISGVLISIPIMIVNILVTIIMGISSRMIPQLNVLVVSFIVNIGLGLFVFCIISDEFFTVCYEMYKKQLEIWYMMIV